MATASISANSVSGAAGAVLEGSLVLGAAAEPLLPGELVLVEGPGAGTGDGVEESTITEPADVSCDFGLGVPSAGTAKLPDGSGSGGKLAG